MNGFGGAPALSRILAITSRPLTRVNFRPKCAHSTGPSGDGGQAVVYYRHAVETLRLLSASMVRYSRAFGQALSALDAYLATPKEIVIIGDSLAAHTQELLHTVHGCYLPSKVLVIAHPNQVDALSQRLPLLADRTLTISNQIVEFYPDYNGTV